MTTVQNLIDALQQYDPESPVRLMSQSTYPFEYDIDGIWQNMNNDDYDAFVDDGSGHKPVFLVEGRQRGYGTKRAWDEMERI